MSRLWPCLSSGVFPPEPVCPFPPLPPGHFIVPGVAIMSHLARSADPELLIPFCPAFCYYILGLIVLQRHERPSSVSTQNPGLVFRIIFSSYVSGWQIKVRPRTRHEGQEGE